MAELVPLLFIAIAVVFLLVLSVRQRKRAMQAQAQQLQASLRPGHGGDDDARLATAPWPRSATTRSTWRSRPGVTVRSGEGGDRRGQVAGHRRARARCGGRARLRLGHRPATPGPKWAGSILGLERAPPRRDPHRGE